MSYFSLADLFSDEFKRDGIEILMWNISEEPMQDQLALIRSSIRKLPANKVEQILTETDYKTLFKVVSQASFQYCSNGVLTG